MIKVKCTMCKKVVELDVTFQQFAMWQKGALIQRVMPHLSDAERELLISGTCGDCFDELFRNDEDDDLIVGMTDVESGIL